VKAPNIRTSPGDTYHHLTVIRELPERKGRQIYYECQCECGNIISVRGSNLRNGNTKSCGCFKIQQLIERSTVHSGAGRRKEPLYKIWSGMRQRCYDSNADKYSRYGGRGINVCDRWQDYNSFRDDMSSGYKPGLELDRIDNDGDYCPENCRWVSHKTNCRNKSTNRIINTPKGSMTLVEAAEAYSIPYDTLKKRINRSGWDSIKAVTTPVKRR